MKLLMSVAAWLCASVTWAQLLVPEKVAEHEPIVAAVVIEAGPSDDCSVSWQLEECCNAIEVDDQTLHIWSPPGKHLIKCTVQIVRLEEIEVSTPDGGTRVIRSYLGSELRVHEAEFIVGEAVDPPGPPPGPEPPPPTPGKRTVVILHESEDATPQFSRMVNGLRSGDNAKYLKDRGHTLLIIDDDTTDEIGRPLEVVTQLSADGLPMPALFVLDEGGAVVHKQPLSPEANAAGVMEVLKGNGG